MDLFQAIGVAGKFFQLIMQLFLQGNIDLVSPFGDNSSFFSPFAGGADFELSPEKEAGPGFCFEAVGPLGWRCICYVL